MQISKDNFMPVCLVGDFNLIYREPSSNATGTQPIPNWRVF